MKKVRLAAKVASITALVMIVLAFSVATPTFSWFDRANTLTGDGLEYSVKSSDNVYTYDGKNITISTTYSSTGENDSYAAISPPVKKNGSLAKGKRDYYETTITNTSGAAQNVSLYISDLKSTNTTGELCVGVNTPIKAYRNFTDKEKGRTQNSTGGATGDKIRIYFQPKNADKWNGADGGYVIYYMTPIGNGWTAPMDVTGTAGTLFTDIPTNTTKFYIKINNADGDSAWGRTPDITVNSLGGENSGHPTSLNAQNECVFVLTEQTSTENSYGNAGYNVYSIDGANIFNYYGSASVSKDDSLDLSLIKGTNFNGKNIQYESSDTNVFTVSGGRIYGKSVGSATLTTKVYSESYGEAYQVTTSISVTAVTTNKVSIDDAPIITNLKVPTGVENAVSVKWFIMNDNSAAGTLTYTLENVYLGL